MLSKQNLKLIKVTVSVEIESGYVLARTSLF